MDVVDVTELYKGVNFATPLSLTEVLSLPPETFPAVVEVAEGPGARSLLRGSWLQELRPGSCLVFHGTGTSAMILMSGLKSRAARQYFLVSQHYGGRFRRRPREFNSVYELHVASIQAPGLKVSVTRNFDGAEEEDLPALGVGDRLEVVRCEWTDQRQAVQGLLCRRLQEPDDGDDEDDEDESTEVVLPLHMEGHFVEVLADNRKYRLADLSEKFSFPMDVKLVSRDAELDSDPLAAFPCLRLEGATSEETVQASFPHRPDHCFEIPKWVSMTVVFTEDSLPWPSEQPPKCRVDRVTEVADTFFHEFVIQENVGAAPPPRPPKTGLSSKSMKKSSNQSEKCIPTKGIANLTLNSKGKPPAPLPPPSMAEMTPNKALPNTHGETEKTEKQLCHVAGDVDSDDHYETVDENFFEESP